MKDIRKAIEYNGVKYPVVFNLNVMERIQEEYGELAKWGELTDGSRGEPNAKAIIFGLTEMINEGIDIENEETGEERKFLTKKQVGRIVTNVGLENATKVTNDAVIESTKVEQPKNA